MERGQARAMRGWVDGRRVSKRGGWLEREGNRDGLVDGGWARGVSGWIEGDQEGWMVGEGG